MRALLPVITTRRPDKRDRGYLAWVAVAGEIAHLPLETAPIDASSHVLEIYVEGFELPLVVIADPMGPPDEHGAFPLKLSPLDEAHATALREELFGAAAAQSAAPAESGAEVPAPRPLAPPTGPRKRTSTIPPPLTTSHAAALTRTTGGAGPTTASRRAPGALSGRALADGRFVLEGLIGGGASGEVYRAVHTVLRRPVAVKVLHPSLQYSNDYCARFYAEALAASQLDHRNVLRIVDYGQEPDGILYIVMELLEGRNLQQILDEEGPLPLERLVRLATQACAGLGHAHDAGVVHRDIKPENVVVVTRKDDEGNASDLVKVCDFGIAHWVPDEQKDVVSDDDATLVRLPDSKKVVGTPAYMAPEQIRNDPVDARTDVYAMGVLLYELSTGRLPFESERPMEVLMLHVMERPKPPTQVISRDFNPDLEFVILKALEKEPAKRYPDVRALRAALRDLIDDDMTAGTGQHRHMSAQSMRAVTDVSSDPAAALAAVSAADGKARGVALRALGGALHAAISKGDVRGACEMLAWLQQRFEDPALPGEEREELDRAFRVLRDPAPARAFAGLLLSGRLERHDEAGRLLAIAGPVAARSLLEARKAQPPSLETRARFVAAMRATGPAALPVILGGLEPLAGLVSRSDEALAEDLLRSAPDVRSDLGGEIAVRFVRQDRPALSVVALRAVVAFWGARAHALLLGVLDSTVDPVRLAAIEALERLPALDDWTIERLGRIVLGQGLPSLELRVAAAGALSLAPSESRPRVLAFLQERLLPPAQGLVGSLINKAFGPKEDVVVVLALARSLATLDPQGSTVVISRVITARPELRAELERLVAGRAPS